MVVNFLQLMDGFGTVAFALTGCLVAAEKKADLIGFWFLAITAGVGGGTIRDCVLGLAPVFWVKDPLPLIECSLVALGSYWFLKDGPLLRPALLWADAVGLAFFAILGATITLASGAPWFIAVLLGTLTAVGGGIIRDLLAGEPTLVLRRDVYASACVIGICLYVGQLQGWFGIVVPQDVALWLSALVIFTLRALAIHFRLELAGYGEARPFNRRKRDGSA